MQSIFWIKKIVEIFLTICITLAQREAFNGANRIMINQENEVEIVDGSIPSETDTTIHYLNMEGGDFVRIANPIPALCVGESHRLTVAVNKGMKTEIGWQSDNPAVAEINPNTGEITTVSEGEAIITMYDRKNNRREDMLLTVLDSDQAGSCISNDEWMLCSDEMFGDKEIIRIPSGIKLIVVMQGDYGSGGYFGLYHEKNSYYSVDGNNTNYYSVFGSLYAYPYRQLKHGKLFDYPFEIDGGNYAAKSGRNTLLIYYQNNGESTFYVPEGVEEIDNSVFRGAENLKRIVLPETVTTLCARAFCLIKKEVEIVIPASVTIFEMDLYSGFDPFVCGYDGNYDSITIVTPKGSAAEKYAIEHGIKYRNME